MGQYQDSASLPNRGDTLYDDGVTPASPYRGRDQWGQRQSFEDVNPNTGQRYSQGSVYAILLQNLTGVTLQAGQACHVKDGSFSQAVDRLSYLGAEGPTVTVDEYVGPNGVAPFDSCWFVVQGPTACLLSSTAGTLNVVNLGDPLVSITGAGTTAADAGRLQTITASVTGSNGPPGLLNIVGYAETTSVTTSSTTALYRYRAKNLKL